MELKKLKHGVSVGTYNPNYLPREEHLRDQPFLKSERFDQYSIHHPKKAEGEEITDFEALPDRCKHKVFPVMPSHMELALFNTQKLETVREMFEKNFKKVASTKHNAHDFSSEAFDLQMSRNSPKTNFQPSSRNVSLKTHAFVSPKAE